MTDPGTEPCSVRAGEAPGRTRAPSPVRGDRGMVLLEAALAVPLLLLVALAGLWLVLVGVGEVAVVAAARDAAVLAGRGASESSVVARVQQSLPTAQVRLHDGADQVRVEVRDAARLPEWLGSLVFDHVASFTAVREPLRWG